MAIPGFAADGALPTFTLVVGTLLFAAGAAATLLAIRLCLDYPRAASVLAGFGILAAISVVLLWLDGRIDRYFVPSFWLVVALGFPIGALTTVRGEVATITTAGWVAVFAVVFAVRLPLGIRIGSAAVIGLVIEVLAVSFTAFPVVVAGAVVGSLARTLSTAPSADE